MKYVYVDYLFDVELWAAVVADACQKHGRAEIAEIMGMSENGIRNWVDGYYQDDYPYPSMTLFLRMVNLLDDDPRRFFKPDDR